MDPFDFVQSILLDDDREEEEEEDDLLLVAAVVTLGHEHGRQCRIARRHNAPPVPHKETAHEEPPHRHPLASPLWEPQ